MFNPVIVKKYLAFFALGALPTTATVVGIVKMGATNGALIGGFAWFVSMFIANWLLDNPFKRMLEGQGILCIGLDSTGVLDFGIVAVRNGRLEGSPFGTKVSAPYDHDLISTLYAPLDKNEGAILHESEDKEKNKRELLVVDMAKLRRFRYGFAQYPVLIYNKVTKTFVPKDFLGSIEKSMSSHLIYIANARAKELSNNMLGFSRGVVEAERFTTDKGDWIKKILIVVGILLIAFFVWKFFSGGAGNVIGSAVSNAGSVITPR